MIYFLNNQKYFQRGFSLVEAIVYVGLVSVLSLILANFSINVLAMEGQNQAADEVEYQGAQAMRIMTQAIRNSEAINSPAAGASQGSLSLTFLAGAINPTVFSSAAGVLQISEAGGGNVPLTNGRVIMENLAFKNLGAAGTPGAVAIQFSLRSADAGNHNHNYVKNFYATASLR